MLEVSDGLILAMKEPFFPITKMIWLLMGRIEPDAAFRGLRPRRGQGMAILAVSLFVASQSSWAQSGATVPQLTRGRVNQGMAGTTIR